MLRFWTWPRQRIIEKKVATWNVAWESIVDRATEKYHGHGALKFRQAFEEILVGNNRTQPGQPTKGVQLSFEDLLHVQRKKILCAQYTLSVTDVSLLSSIILCVILWKAECSAGLHIQWDAQMSSLVLKYNNCVQEIRQCATTGESCRPRSGAAEPWYAPRPYKELRSCDVTI